MVSDVLPENVNGLPYVSWVSDRPCSSMHLARCQLMPSVPFQPAPHPVRHNDQSLGRTKAANTASGCKLRQFTGRIHELPGSICQDVLDRQS